MRHGRVFLVGFMCSGKSTVGKLLAEELGWKFVDVDEEIVRREGLTIPEIFEKKGEDYFRELEFRLLEELAGEEGVVISTGGGLGANPRAMEFMKDRGLVVWLRVSYEEFLRRCGSDPNRPLLRRGEEELRKLMKEREEVYSLAELWIEESSSPKDAVRSIEEKLRGEG